MKKLLLLLFLLPLISFATNKYEVAGGTGNYNSTSNWSLTSGGGSGAAVPSSSDSVFLNGSSGNLTINVASNAKAFICTGYTGVLTFNGTLTVAGNVTFVSGMGTIAGTSDLILNTSCTITSGGKILTGGLQCNLFGAQTVTLADDWTINGTLLTNSNTSNTFNGNIFHLKGSFTLSRTCSGTTLISMEGTGTWSTTNSSVLSNDLTFNTSGTITISGTLLYQTGTITATASTGTIITTSSTLTIQNSCTLNTSHIIWNNINMSVAVKTYTINSLLSATGTLTTTGTSTFAGTSGWTVGTWVQNTGGSVITFHAGNTYTITASATTNGTLSIPVTFVSSTPTSVYYLNLVSGSVQDIGFTSPTDADSSAGLTWWVYKGTISNTLNWRLIATPVTISY